MVQTEKFEQMKLKLKDTITMKDYIPNKFQIFAWEAGLGKSKYSTEYIIEAMENAFFEGRGIPTFLIVKKFVSDVEETIKKIRDSVVGELLKEDFIIGLKAENWDEYVGRTNILNNAVVIVMTHQRYVKHCKEGLPFYLLNKQTLIIDEKVQLPIYKYNKKEYDAMRPSFPYSFQKEFDKLNEPLLLKLEALESESKTSLKQICIKFDTDTIVKFKNLVSKRVKLKKKEVEFLDSLTYFYNQPMYYNNSGFFTADYDYKLRMLKNNIILDASAAVDSIYADEQFEIVEDRRIIDYSNSKFFVVPVTSGKSNFKDNIDKGFVDELANYFTTEKGLGKKQLFITHKQYATDLAKAIKKNNRKVHLPLKSTDEENSNITDLKDYNVAINWYGNIVGQNNYSDYDMCAILATFNFPYPAYLLQFALYNPKQDISKCSLEIKYGKFEDERLEQVRKGAIAAEFYQAMKRIQRNSSPKGLVYIFNKDEEIIALIGSQLLNAEFKTMNKKWKSLEKKKRDTNADKLEAKIKMLPLGEYTKTEVAQMIGKTAKQISDDWKKQNIQELVAKGFIEIKKHNVLIVKEIK